MPQTNLPAVSKELIAVGVVAVACAGLVYFVNRDAPAPSGSGSSSSASDWWCIHLNDGSVCDYGRDACERKRSMTGTSEECYSVPTVYAFTYERTSGRTVTAASDSRAACELRRSRMIATGSQVVNECHAPE